MANKNQIIIGAGQGTARRAPKDIRVLVACEESQAVCIEFRKLDFDAYSCDILPCSGGHPEWHIQCDCRIAIKSRFWDLIIFHPDCTYMSVSGNRWYGVGMSGHQKRIDAIIWTIDTWELIKKHSEYSVLENPVSVIFSEPELRNPQYVQPWMFGHGETKKTGLKLRNLLPLKPTSIVAGREQRIWKMSPGPERKSLRSKTFPGIAEAFAKQFGSHVLCSGSPAQDTAEICHTAPNSASPKAAQISMELEL